MIVDLTKGNSGLKRVMVGLGWDEAEKPTGFSRLFGGRSVQDFDCDAMAFVLQKGKIVENGATEDVLSKYESFMSK